MPPKMTKTKKGFGNLVVYNASEHRKDPKRVAAARKGLRTLKKRLLQDQRENTGHPKKGKERKPRSKVEVKKVATGYPTRPEGSRRQQLGLGHRREEVTMDLHETHFDESLRAKVETYKKELVNMQGRIESKLKLNGK